MIERLLTGMATIIIGLNIVALGVWSNGGAHRRNPIWSALSSFLNFEVFILKGSLAAGLTYLLYSAMRKAGETKTVDLPLVKPEALIPIPVDQATDIQTAPPKKPIEVTPPPIPPTPTTEDLKRKAIEQIVRGF